MGFKIRHFHMVIIIILSFIVYANTFSNPFVFDDEFFIEDNFKIRSLGNIPSFFSEPSVGNLYRPVRAVLYSLTFFLWEFNPAGYHLNAILLHTFISVFVYLIVAEITGKRRISLFSAVLFVLHPIHTARVSNMTAGFDLLGILFLFWAFYSYVCFRKHDSRKAFFYSVILFILGVLSSEEAVVFPLLVLLYDLCFMENFESFRKLGAEIKSRFRYYWLYIVSLLVYLAIRFSVLSGIGRSEVYFLGDLQARILSTLVIFLRYIYIMVWPMNLTIEYNVVVYDSLFSLKILGAILIYALLIFSWLRLYKNHRIAFFSIGWFFVTLLPFSNILPMFTFMADRYLYVPSFGFVLLIAYLLELIRKHSRTFVFLILVMLIIFYSSLTIIRNTEWESDDILFQKAIERQPNNSIAHNDIGQLYQEKGLYDKAFESYERAISLNKNNHVAWLNLGTLHGEIGNYSLAVKYINRSLSIHESYKGYNNLGLIYNRMGYPEESILELKKAIDFNPRLTKAYMDLGVVYAENDEFEQALLEFDKALSINPEIADIHYNLGILYRMIGREEESKRELGIADSLGFGS